ncbi:pyocin knob domain-containing S74 family peptidase, partial [Klebsiella variicola]|uniref:pyocin knob domain-containing S74 family peptidase n=2 Tax=Enterobacteriaceae TaxID=543 RepID=UPI001FCC38D5
ITSGSMFGGDLNNYLNTIKNDITAGDNKQVSKTGDTMTGNLTINANLKVENPNGTMVDLGSENSDKYSRLTLARKVGSGATVAMLKVTPEGHVQFGYQDAVATPAPSKYILVKSNGLEVEGDLVFNQTYRGAEDAVNITDKTNDLNNMVIKGSDLGTRLLYKCTSTGGGSNISNKPTSDGNFVLEVLSLRKISDTDWTCKQTFTTKNGGVEGTYVRYCQNGTWSAWKEVVAGVQPINLGGTGATSVASARNNLGVGEGQTVSFGNLVTNDLTANGNVRLVGRLNLGSTSATGVLRANEGGAVVLGSASGQNIHVRAGSADTSAGETRFEPNGNVVVGGAITASGSLQVNGEAAMSRSLIVSQNIKNTNDNSFILMGKDSDLGFVKKSNSGAKLVFASGKSFIVAKSSATAIANPASETYTDVFKVDADGNQTVYGNSEVSRALTVSSSATVNDVINANGGIIVPTTKYVQIADAPTQNNQATNKKYVDDMVASAISNAGDTYLPLAGGTVTGNLDITGTRLKTASLWVTGNSALNGALEVGGKANFLNELTAKTSINIMNAGNSHLFFRKADGTEKGLVYADDPGNVSVRAGGGSGPVWNFWNSGSCQFPGAISNYNGINSTTNYPGGGNGAYLNTGTLRTGFSNGAYAALYFQEHVGNTHQAILNVNGYGRDESFYFRAGGVIDTPLGMVQTSGSDVRIKSDFNKPKDGARERIMKLGVSEFKMNGDFRNRRGFIAQQVETVDEEYVFQGSEQEIDGEKIKILNVDQTAIVADMVTTIQEQDAEINDLKAELAIIKKMISALKKQAGKPA